MRWGIGKSSRWIHILSGLFVVCGIAIELISRTGWSAGAVGSDELQNEDISHFERETKYANLVVTHRRNVGKEVTALCVYGNCGRRTGDVKRIVGLVELRNAGSSLYGFLRSLEDVVDAIVVLDDHSIDGSRADMFEMCHVRGGGVCKIEVVLNKTGGWVREEVRDRDLLLRMGRAIGGSHFVLLDYDEYFSANCVRDGSVRQGILGLKPGESLFVPWVEMWRSIRLQRVLRFDRDMNFLVRRQSVVFADDGFVQYSRNSTNARLLGNGTIHALRCPRSICPRPPRYVGPQTETVLDDRVKQLLGDCRIIETRFLSMANVLLKSAWYQGLGRIMGAGESSTRGKMLDALFPINGKSLVVSGGYGTRDRGDSVSVERVKKNWLTMRNERDGNASRNVEIWRADELVRWVDEIGGRQFSNLSAIQYIDMIDLRHVVGMSRVYADAKMVFVPRRKLGTFVVVIENENARCASEVVGAFGTKVEIDGMESFGLSGLRDSKPASKVEAWRGLLQRSVRAGILKSKKRVAFLSAAGMSTDDLIAFVEMAENDLSDFDVVFLFSETRKRSDGNALKRTVNTAVVPGSHIRVIRMEPGAYGSYSAVLWLRFRLLGEHDCSLGERMMLLAMAEKFHSRQSTDRIPKPLPVARVIFSLNVGRSGSKYVASIVSSLGRGIRGFHEPRCADGKCSGGGAMSMQKVRLADSYESRMDVKIPMIRTAIGNIAEDGVGGMVDFLSDDRYECENVVGVQRNASSRVVFEANSGFGCGSRRIRDFVYVETNANFKSWFYDVSLDNFPKMGYAVSVIVLRKYIAAVLKSLYETGYFSVRNGYNWMETANGVNSMMRSIGEDESVDAFDKLISYILNAETVTRAIMAKYGQDVEFLEMQSEDVYGRNGTMRLLAMLGLQPTSRTLHIAGQRVDKYGKGTEKRRLMTTSLKECERRVENYLLKCRKLGILYPANMHHLKRYQGFEYDV